MKKLLIYDGGIKEIYGLKAFFARFIYYRLNDNIYNGEKVKVYGVKYVKNRFGRKVKVNKRTLIS